MFQITVASLESPGDRGAWWAAVYGVAQSPTRLKRLSSSSTEWYQFHEGAAVLTNTGSCLHINALLAGYTICNIFLFCWVLFQRDYSFNRSEKPSVSKISPLQTFKNRKEWRVPRTLIRASTQVIRFNLHTNAFNSMWFPILTIYKLSQGVFKPNSAFSIAFLFIW